MREHRTAVLALSAAAIGVAALLLFTLAPRRGNQRSFESLAQFAYPGSIEELVRRSDLIVTGEIAKVNPSKTTVLITPQPTQTPADFPAPPDPMIAISTTRILIDIQTTHLDDAGPRPLIYERWGDTTSRSRPEWVFGNEGDSYLFFLRKHPETDDYIVPFGACGQVAIDTTGPACSDVDGTVLAFMEGMTSAEFIAAVEGAIR